MSKKPYFINDDHEIIVNAIADKTGMKQGDILSFLIETGISTAVSVHKPDFDMNVIKEVMKASPIANETTKLIYDGWDNGKEIHKTNE